MISQPLFIRLGRTLAALVVLAVVSGAACSFDRGVTVNMPFGLQNYATADEAKQAIAAALPNGTSRRAVEEWLEKSGIECFPGNYRDPYIACRHVEKSANMVHTVWSLGFFFTERRELERIEVSRGLAGP